MRWKVWGVEAGMSVKKLSTRFSGRLPTTCMHTLSMLKQIYRV